MTASEIRALFAVASRPEVVSLAGGMPVHRPRCRWTRSARCSASWSRTTAPRRLQYGAGQGDARLRERICDVMALEGIARRLARRRRGHRRRPAGAGPRHPDLPRPGRRGARRGRRPTSARSACSSAAEAEVVHVPMDDDGLIPAALEAGASPRSRGGPTGEVPLHDPELPQPGRRDALRVAPRAEILEHLRAARPAGHRGQPVRPARLRRASRCRRCGPGARAGRLPQLVLEDLRAGPAGRLGARAARRPREAGAASEAQVLCPRDVRPVRGRRLPGHPAVARAGQGLPRALPGAAGRDARRAGRADAGRHAPGPARTAASTSG